MIWMHVSAILGIQAAGSIQLMSWMIKTVFYWEEVKSEIWGSPGSRQLLQLQLFPKFKFFLGTSFNSFLLSFGFAWYWIKITSGRAMF